MKKFLKYFFSVVLIFFVGVSLVGCNTHKSEVKNKIKTSTYDYYEEIKDKIADINEIENKIKTIKNYLDDKKISFKAIDKNSILIEKSKTEDKDVEKNSIGKLIFVITIEEDNKELAQNISTILSILKNKEDYQEFSAIITADIKGVDEKYFKDKNIVVLNSYDENKISIGSVGSKEIDISKNIRKNRPKGELAYNIKIEGLSNIDSGNRKKKHTNPITYVAGILIRAKSADLNVELANFSSVGNIDEFPSGIDATFVVDKSNEAKFESRLKDSEKDFNEKNRKKDKEAKFTYEKVELPKKTLSYDDTTNFLSLIYTLEDGVVKTTEEDYNGDVLGLFTIAKSSISEDKATLSVMARFVDKQTEQEMIDNYQMTSSLLDYKTSLNERYAIWSKKEENEKFWKENKLSEKIFGKNLDMGVNLEETQISNLSDDVKKQNIVEIRFEFKDYVEIIENLISIL